MIYYIYYKYKQFLHVINIVMDSIILDQLNNLQLVEKDVDSEAKVIKTRRGRNKKTDTKTLPTINEEDTNDIIEKRNGLVACILSGNSKQYLRKGYTEQQIDTAITLIYCQIDPNPFQVHK